jgi:hypothetical protein
VSSPSQTAEGAVNIPTRYAIVMRAKKLLKEIDDYFEDAANFGLNVKEADPTGEMMGWRKGIIAMLERERALGIVNVDSRCLPK